MLLQTDLISSSINVQKKDVETSKPDIKGQTIQATTVCDITIKVNEWRNTLNTAETECTKRIYIYRAEVLLKFIIPTAAMISDVVGILFSVLQNAFNSLGLKLIPIIAAAIVLIGGGGYGLYSLISESNEQKSQIAQVMRPKITSCIEDLTPSLFKKNTDLPFVRFTNKFISHAKISPKLKVEDLIDIHELYIKAFKLSVVNSTAQIEEEYEKLSKNLAERQLCEQKKLEILNEEARKLEALRERLA